MDKVKMNELQDIINRNPKLFGNVDYFIKHYPVNDVIIVDGNALVRGTSDLDWVFFLVDDPLGFVRLLPYVTDGDKNFSVIEKYMMDAIISDTSELTMSLDCMRVILSDEAERQVLAEFDGVGDYTEHFDIGEGYDIRCLVADDVSYIYDNYEYKSYTTTDYLLDRIEGDLAFGITYHGQLVAWGMTHDEGSIGVIHVMEDFRRRSFGKIISKILTYEKLKKGEVPFMHIEHDNVASLRMAESLGYERDRQILWISRK